MKNIISGMVAGGVAGLAIDGSMNKKGEHDYLSSLVLGAAVGGIGVGVWGAKAAPGLINTSSHHAAPAPTPHAAPAPTPHAAPAPTPHAAPAPTQKGPGILSTAQTRISSAGALVWEKSLEAGKNVWGKLNSDIPTPNIKWPHLPSINVNLDPARQFANKAASASINTISSAGHKLSSSASQVSEKIANKAKKLIATARQNHIPPIRLKAPSINLRMPSMPTNLLSGVQNQIENGIKASSGYVKKGLFAIAVAASSIASHGPSFNPVVPNITHAQQSMATSTMTKARLPTTTSVAADNKSYEIFSDPEKMAKSVIDNKINNNAPFVMVDKSDATISIYDTTGKRMGKWPALLGQDYQNELGAEGLPLETRKKIKALIEDPLDAVTGESYNLVEKLKSRATPTGLFRFKKAPNTAEGYESDYGLMNLIRENDPYKLANAAIHNVYTLKPEQLRAERLGTPTIADNYISQGCVNVDPKTLQVDIMPKLEDKALVVVLPYNPKNKFFSKIQ